ncbi:MAG: mycothiol conjugate amidase Mca [Armatimonadetes bacterium]|nr:MAG: mycothiol conjugate amidase Mca [Armatimonadota bacterium]
MSKTLLALHAHPDDESSKGAGTICRYAANGVRCVLVTATGGEAGDILNPAMDRPEIKANLKAVREAELAEAAAIQGYSEVILLGYRDSGMPDSRDNADPRAFCNQPIDEVLGKLVAIVREERPDVLIGYDDHEFYPHPDHLRVHELSLLVFDAAADPKLFPDSGEPWEIKKLYAPTIFTQDRIRTIHDAMLDRTGGSPYDRWVEMMESRPIVPRDMTRIDVSGFVEQSRDALRAHRTQIDPDGQWFAVPTDLVEEVYPWEDFEMIASRVGWSSGEDDLFAGIE